MILDECHFTFGEFDSHDYDMIFAHLDTGDNGIDDDVLYGTTDPTYVYNRRNYSNSLIGDDFEDGVLKIDIEIFNECGDPWTQQQRREIETTLFRQQQYQRLYIDMVDDTYGDTYEYIDGELKQSYFNCRFINPKKIRNSADIVIGYKVTLETDSIMLWQDEIKYTMTSAGTLTVNVDTDIFGYTYPDIKVTGCNGSFTLKNLTDDPERVTSLTAKQDFEINSSISYVTSTVYESFSTKYFPRLVNGENQIQVTGSFSKLEFVFQNRRYL